MGDKGGEECMGMRKISEFYPKRPEGRKIMSLIGPECLVPSGQHCLGEARRKFVTGTPFETFSLLSLLGEMRLVSLLVLLPRLPA